MRILVSIQQPVHAWQIPASAVAALRERFPRLTFVHATDAQVRAEGLASCEVAYTWILSPAELARAPRLRWVHTSAVAVETLCLPELFARGVLVTNSRGVQATPIAEHALALMLALARQLPFAIDNQRAARWSQNEFADDRLPWLLRGRTLAIIGLGTIGREIARLAAAFGMRVIAMRRQPDRGGADGVAELVPTSALGDLLRRADVLVVAVPLTPETDGLIGSRELARMKPQAIVINVGRARVLDTDSLVNALAARKLGGAALDVFPQEPLPSDHPLWTCPNVLLTPHTSGFRSGHWEAAIDVFSENLRRYERGDELLFRVDPAGGY
jgi:phosphoglycerate dehydrogenase-like enzyme